MDWLTISDVCLYSYDRNNLHAKIICTVIRNIPQVLCVIYTTTVFIAYTNLLYFSSFFNQIYFRDHQVHQEPQGQEDHQEQGDEMVNGDQREKREIQGNQ